LALRATKEDGTRIRGKARRTGETEKDVKTTATSAKERDSERKEKEEEEKKGEREL